MGVVVGFFFPQLLSSYIFKTVLHNSHFKVIQLETCLSYILQCYKDLRDVKQFSLAINYLPTAKSIEAAKKKMKQSAE